MSLLFILIGVLGSIIFLTTIIWNLVKFEWLQGLSLALVFSLPFERIPSLILGGSNLRASQVLTALGFYLVLILVLKKDEKLRKMKLISNFGWLICFVILSIPSWFFVVDYNRFWTTQLATMLAFGSCWLVAHFASVWSSLKALLASLTLVGMFGIYQFVADLVWNLPTALTGLRPQYTKAVFGYPRVQATAIEPLYLAGILFWPMFLLILLLLNRVSLQDFWSNSFSKNWSEKLPKFTWLVIFSKKFKSIKNFKIQKSVNSASEYKYETSSFNFFNLFAPVLNFSKIFFSLNWLFLAFFLTVFILTFSKGGWLFFGLALTGLFGFYARRLSKKFWRLGTSLAVVIAGMIWSLTLIFPSFSNSFSGFGRHLAEIISGQAATIAERSQFLNIALDILPGFSLFGIGSGQYGLWARQYVGGSEGFLIVNNVYVEVWLEFGFLSFICFIGFLITPLWSFWCQMGIWNQIKKAHELSSVNLEPDLSQALLTEDLILKDKNLILSSLNTVDSENRNQNLNLMKNFHSKIWLVCGQSLVCALLAYYLQWLSFSPIFINPIFILMGLLLAFLRESSDTVTDFDNK